MGTTQFIVYAIVLKFFFILYEETIFLIPPRQQYNSKKHVRTFNPANSLQQRSQAQGLKGAHEINIEIRWCDFHLL